MSSASTLTMPAAMTTAWNQMQVTQLPVPVPGPGQVRIATRLAGICGSDLHIFQGHHPTAKAPIVQGHEFVGIIDAIGPDTLVNASVGQRVVVEPLISCGRCEACRRGLVHVCRQLKLLGIHENGAFAKYFIAPAAKVIAVPEGLADEVAVLAEPFAVGVHVCQRAKLPPGGRSLVIGAGPIGLIVAMVAQTCGQQVTLCEISEARLQQARSLGFAVIDGRNEAPAAAKTMTEGDGYDTVFEVSGSAPGLSLAIEAARVQGTLVQVGFFGKPPVAELFKLTLKELTLVGSRVYEQEDFRRAVRMLAMLDQSKRFPLEQLISETIGLGGIADAIARSLAGAVSGKVLVKPEG